MGTSTPRRFLPAIGGLFQRSMNAAIIRRATLEDAEVLGIIGPAAYAEGYGYLWDRPDAYSDQLRTFGPQGGFREIGRRRFEKPVKVHQSEMIVLLKEVKQ